MATVVVGAAGMVRLTAGGFGGPAAAPLLGSAALGFVVPALLHRTKLSGTWVAVIGTLVVVGIAWWSAAPRHGSSPFPAARSLLPTAAELHRAHSVLAAFHLPLDPVPAVVFLGCVLAGVAGLTCRLMLSSPPRLARPALAVVPGAILVAWSSLTVPGNGALTVAAVFAAAVVVGLTMAGSDGILAPGHRRDLQSSGARLVPVAITGLVVVGSTVGAGLVLQSNSAASPRNGTAPTSVIAASTLSLAAGLVSVEQVDARVVVFRARTPTPTYWQVGFLSVWSHDHWLPGPITTGALAGRPTPITSPSPRRGVPLLSASVTLSAYAGHLLPVPPDTVGVSGPPGTGITASGVVTPADRRDASYDATFQVVRPNPYEPAPGSLDAAAGLTPAQLRQDLSLPPVPEVVTALARTETAGATSTLAEGEDLVNWFRSGLFRYTLSPTRPPAGTDPLVAFLTLGRAGSCESFASAFAVMARTLGIPARVAVGFTSGTTGASGTTTVVGADAHAWPELYLGSAAGWVSFEPTPPVPRGPPVPSSVVGNTSPPSSTPTTSPPATVPTSTPPPTSVPTVPSPTGGARRTASSPSVRKSPPGRWPALPLIGVGTALAVLGALFVLATARRRRRHRPPTGMALAALRSVDRSLRRAGAPRPAHRTLVAHAEDLAAGATGTGMAIRYGRGAPVAVLDDVRMVGTVAQVAVFAPGPVTPRSAHDAQQAAVRVRRALRHHRSRRHRSPRRGGVTGPAPP